MYPLNDRLAGLDPQPAYGLVAKTLEDRDAQHSRSTEVAEQSHHLETFGGISSLIIRF